MQAKSVLIIDDEKEVIEVLTLYLQKEGFFVKGASDGEEGLSLINQEHFDCILLDVMLPKLNGFHIVQKIRESHSTPVIMVSLKVSSICTEVKPVAVSFFSDVSTNFPIYMQNCDIVQ